jgi:hypothetical protein
MILQTLFYKTHADFAREYDLSVEYVEEYLRDTKLGQDHPKATVLGMTELQLLKGLCLYEAVEGLEEQDDPRSQVYILSISSNI